MRTKWLMIVGVLGCLLSVRTASATTIFPITDAVLNDPNLVPYGQVTATQNGANVVDVLAELYGGLEFVDTGAHNAFTFNLLGNPAIPSGAVTNLTSGFGIANPLAAGTNPPFGSFMYSITLPNGGDNHHGSTLAFTLTLPGLTEGSFTANSSGYFFAMDTWNQGATRALGAGDPITTTTTDIQPVPEPATLTLFGSGLLFVASRVRRGKNKPE